MNICKYEILSTEATIELLRKVPLRGNNKPDEPKVKIYEKANIELFRGANTDLLIPPQRYVLIPQVETILDIADTFALKGVDVFALTGALLFWTDEMTDDDHPIPFLPPIVEESREEKETIFLVNDGMHRVWAARKRGRNINVFYVSGVPKEYPYYAYPIMEGWSAVEEIRELTEGYQKKAYRDPDNYKALFRQFNVVFPGVQEARAKTSPEELKK